MRVVQKLIVLGALLCLACVATPDRVLPEAAEASADALVPSALQDEVLMQKDVSPADLKEEPQWMKEDEEDSGFNELPADKLHTAQDAQREVTIKWWLHIDTTEEEQDIEKKETKTITKEVTQKDEAEITMKEASKKKEEKELKHKKSFAKKAKEKENKKLEAEAKVKTTAEKKEKSITKHEKEAKEKRNEAAKKKADEAAKKKQEAKTKADEEKKKKNAKKEDELELKQKKGEAASKEVVTKEGHAKEKSQKTESEQASKETVKKHEQQKKESIKKHAAAVEHERKAKGDANEHEKKMKELAKKQEQQQKIKGHEKKMKEAIKKHDAAVERERKAKSERKTKIGSRSDEVQAKKEDEEKEQEVKRCKKERMAAEAKSKAHELKVKGWQKKAAEQTSKAEVSSKNEMKEANIKLSEGKGVPIMESSAKEKVAKGGVEQATKRIQQEGMQKASHHHATAAEEAVQKTRSKEKLAKGATAEAHSKEVMSKTGTSDDAPCSESDIRGRLLHISPAAVHRAEIMCRRWIQGAASHCKAVDSAASQCQSEQTVVQQTAGSTPTVVQQTAGSTQMRFGESAECQHARTECERLLDSCKVDSQSPDCTRSNTVCATVPSLCKWRTWVVPGTVTPVSCKSVTDIRDKDCRSGFSRAYLACWKAYESLIPEDEQLIGGTSQLKITVERCGAAFGRSTVQCSDSLEQTAGKSEKQKQDKCMHLHQQGMKQCSKAWPKKTSKAWPRAEAMRMLSGSKAKVYWPLKMP